MEHTFNITWGQRVHICNLFPTLGSLYDMHVSHIMRGILIESVDAKVLANNGIVKDELGIYIIVEKNEGRASEITLDDESLAMFYEFVKDLDAKRQVPIAFEGIFNTIVETYESTTHDPREGEGDGNDEPEPQEL